MSPPPMTAPQMKAIRMGLQLTQEGMAKVLCLHRVTVAHLERGAVPASPIVAMCYRELRAGWQPALLRTERRLRQERLDEDRAERMQRLEDARRERRGLRRRAYERRYRRRLGVLTRRRAAVRASLRLKKIWREKKKKGSPPYHRLTSEDF